MKVMMDYFDISKLKRFMKPGTLLSLKTDGLEWGKIGDALIYLCRENIWYLALLPSENQLMHLRLHEFDIVQNAK